MWPVFFWGGGAREHGAVWGTFARQRRCRFNPCPLHEPDEGLIRKKEPQLKLIERNAWIALALVTVFGLGIVFLDAYLRR